MPSDVPELAEKLALRLREEKNLPVYFSKPPAALTDCLLILVNHRPSGKRDRATIALPITTSSGALVFPGNRCWMSTTELKNVSPCPAVNTNYGNWKFKGIDLYGFSIDLQKFSCDIHQLPEIYARLRACLDLD